MRWGLSLQGGSHEEGKASPRGTPSGQRQGAALEPQRGTQKQVIRKQNGENLSLRQLPNSTTQSRISLHTSCSEWNGRWVRRLRLRGSDPRVRTGIECCEDTLKGLVQQRGGSPGKSLGLPERSLTPHAFRSQELTFVNPGHSCETQES